MSRRFAVSICWSLAASAAAALAAASCAAAAPSPAGPAADAAARTRRDAASLLFVQNARQGTFRPIRGRAGAYRLRLRGVDPKVLYFSDRPARDTGLLSQAALLRALFRAGSPAPNAAIEVAGAGARRPRVLAVKLTRPRWDARRRTLAYEARVLRRAAGGLAHYRDRLARRLPARFGEVALFVDSGTAWGNTCSSSVANHASSNLGFVSADKWPTDTWQSSLPGTYLPDTGRGADAGWTTGGFARGCHFTSVWSFDDGSTVTITATNPVTGSNTFACTPSLRTRYQCTLLSSSVIHGPILSVDWRIDEL